MPSPKKTIGLVVRSPVKPHLYLSVRLAITGVGSDKRKPSADCYRTYLTRDRRMATVFPEQEYAEAWALADKHLYRVVRVVRKDKVQA